TTLADHRDDHRHGQLRHLAQVVGNRLSLTTFFSVNAWICARRIDETKDGTAKFLCQFHGPDRFPVPFGLWHSEVSVLTLLRVATLLMSDNNDGQSMKTSKSADHSPIVCEPAVAM